MVFDYLLFLKVFAYFKGTDMQKFLFHFKEIHNYNIILSLSVSKKKELSS